MLLSCHIRLAFPESSRSVVRVAYDPLCFCCYLYYPSVCKARSDSCKVHEPSFQPFNCNAPKHQPCPNPPTESPQWRRGPSNKPTLCNACGTRFRRTNQLGPAGLNAGNRLSGGGVARPSVQAATTSDARARKDTAAAAARELAAITHVAAPKEKEVLPAKRISKRSGHLAADSEANTVQEERSKRQRVPSRHK